MLLRVLLFFIIRSCAQGGSYDINQKIPVYVSSVHPYYNKGEKYKYHYLPWPCRPDHVESHGSMLYALEGERPVESMYDIQYRRDATRQDVCGEKVLNAKEIRAFQKAIEKHFEYEMIIDDLPVRYQVGYFRKANKQEPSAKYYLFTHREFIIEYNGNHIISANISRNVGVPVTLTDGMTKPITLQYSVKWTKTNKARKSAQMHHLSKRIVEAHWLWVLNSSLLVILLTGLLAIILLRTLKNDIARYISINEADLELDAHNDEEIDDSGWKRIRFDIFRTPKHPMLFSAIIGVGAQILMACIILLFLSVIGYFYPGNHRLAAVAILSYLTTSYISGFIAAKKYKEFKGEDWMFCSFLTLSLFAGPFMLCFSVVNTIAWSMGAITALPFPTILAIFLLWALFSFPLGLYGAYKGSQMKIKPYPCSTRHIARKLPQNLPWYYSTPAQIFIAGFLPFIAIYVEVHTLFMSVWGHQVYTLFGILCITFVILLLVTSFVSVLLCYFQLTAEHYNWWWLSLFRGGSCGVFLEAYAIYYWNYTATMDGVLQATMYFAYTFMISYAFALMLATVGHLSSHKFIVTIYSAIKSD